MRARPDPARSPSPRSSSPPWSRSPRARPPPARPRSSTSPATPSAAATGTPPLPVLQRPALSPASAGQPRGPLRGPPAARRVRLRDRRPHHRQPRVRRGALPRERSPARHRPVLRRPRSRSSRSGARPSRERKLAPRGREARARRSSARSYRQIAGQPWSSSRSAAYYVNFIPFGAGQFQNRQTGKGIVLASAQGVTGARVGRHLAVPGRLLRPLGSSVPAPRRPSVRRLQQIEIGAGVVFIAPDRRGASSTRSSTTSRRSVAGRTNRLLPPEHAARGSAAGEVAGQPRVAPRSTSPRRRSPAAPAWCCPGSSRSH